MSGGLWWVRTKASWVAVLLDSYRQLSEAGIHLLLTRNRPLE